MSATINITTGTGTATVTLSTGARGPAGADGSTSITQSAITTAITDDAQFRTDIGLGDAATKTVSAGGNGAADSGKVPTFGSAGELFGRSVKIGASGVTATISSSLLTVDHTYSLPDVPGEFVVQTLTGTPVGTVTSGTWNADPIADDYISSAATWNAKQDALVSGTNIKTLASQSLLGSGNITLANIGAQSAITFGTGVQTALGVNVGSAGAPVLFNGAGGTPSSLTLTNATGLPISTGVSGLGTNVATALGTALGTGGGVARAIEIKTSNFTAVVGGRYILESAGTITVTNPTGTTQGDSFECWIGSGSAVINGTTYSASRFSIRARYTGSAWANPSPVLSDAVSFASTTRPTSAGTGTPASTSLITRSDGDARYASISLVYTSTAQIDSTNTTPQDVTGCTGITIDANSDYIVELFARCTTSGGASIYPTLTLSQPHAETTGVGARQIIGWMMGAAPQGSIDSTTVIQLGARTQNATSAPVTARTFFRSGSNAGTMALQWRQWSSPAGTASLLTGAKLIVTKLP